MELNYFSICCIAKNEHHYIREWVIHHLLIGAEKIIIYDNESSPPLRDILEPFIASNLVVIHQVKGKEKQIPSYHECLKNYGPSSKWIGFLDADEFLISNKYKDIRSLLTEYEKYGGLGVHWVEYGSSGHIQRPGGSQLLNFTHRFPFPHNKNLHIKSIVQPERIHDTYNPHKFTYKIPWHCVDENFLPLTESQGPFTAEKIRLNHYYYRSQQDFFEKVDRGRADRADAQGRRNIKSFYPQLEKAKIYDNTGFKYGEKASYYAENLDSLFEFMKKRHMEKQHIDKYSKKALKNLSEHKYAQAESLLKKLQVNLADRKIINFINYKLRLAQDDLNGAIEYNNNLMEEDITPDACLERVKLHLKKQEYQQAKSMLLYIRWRFNSILKKSPA
ncbi:MAG: glycosyltransferase family 2 protein, partial [Thermodesulfobacteriota bacterium]